MIGLQLCTPPFQKKSQSFGKMNHYLIYTTEGSTEAPNKDFVVENCQLLGRVDGNSFHEALDKLFSNNPWIEKAGFSKLYCKGEQILIKTE